MHQDVPKWMPHFACTYRKCRRLPCLLNDVCWVTLSVLIMVALLTNTSPWK